MLALVTLALWKEELQLVPWLKAGIAKKLNEVAVEQEMLERVAHDLRRQAASLRRREFEMNRVLDAMNQLEPAKVQTLMVEIADILSPGTVGEQAQPDFF
jgi:hypothetical protein